MWRNKGEGIVVLWHSIFGKKESVFCLETKKTFINTLKYYRCAQKCQNDVCDIRTWKQKGTFDKKHRKMAVLVPNDEVIYFASLFLLAYQSKTFFIKDKSWHLYPYVYHSGTNTDWGAIQTQNGWARSQAYHCAFFL